jgi:hypothetical protein
VTLPFWAPIDICRYATKELCIVAAQYYASNEAAKLCLAPGSREATPISGKGVPSVIIV